MTGPDVSGDPGVASSLGLESGIVRVVSYDPAWPELYVAEAARIHEAVAAVGLAPLALEHVGSTAIPGLAAKPILDVLAGARGEAPLRSYFEALMVAGYRHRGEQGIPGREFFRRGDPRAYHVHLTAMGSSFWHDHLLFRDHLRRHTDARDAYARLKLALAARFPSDREAYIEAKGPFVLEVLRLASVEAR